MGEREGKGAEEVELKWILFSMNRFRLSTTYIQGSPNTLPERSLVSPEQQVFAGLCVVDVPEMAVLKVLDSGSTGQQDHLLVGRPEPYVLLTVAEGVTATPALLNLKLPHSLNTRLPICVLRGGREREGGITVQPLYPTLTMTKEACSTLPYSDNHKGCMLHSTLH